jgi:hypothetical protein
MINNNIKFRHKDHDIDWKAFAKYQVDVIIDGHIIAKVYTPTERNRDVQEYITKVAKAFISQFLGES